MSFGRGIAFLAVVECSPLAYSQGLGSALRDLPDYYLSGTPSPVTITIIPPPISAVAGIEDVPPSGWQISAITHGGSFDAPSGKVKWGPFFSPSIPAMVSYDAAPPAGTSGPHCFVGIVSFDGVNQPIGGNSCIPVGVPAMGKGGLAILSGILAAAGGWLVHWRRGPSEGRPN